MSQDLPTLDVTLALIRQSDIEKRSCKSQNNEGFKVGERPRGIHSENDKLKKLRKDFENTAKPTLFFPFLANLNVGPLLTLSYLFKIYIVSYGHIEYERHYQGCRHRDLISNLGMGLEKILSFQLEFKHCNALH